jgi:hypothetical protein
MRGTIQANLLVDSTEQFFFQWFRIISESGKITRRETPLCSMISDEEKWQPLAMARPANKGQHWEKRTTTSCDENL